MRYNMMKTSKQTSHAALTVTGQKFLAIQKTITEKVKIYLAYLLIAVTMVTAFFVHEFFTPSSSEIESARVEWSEAKSLRTIHLEKLKEMAQGTPEYDQYLESKILTDQLFDKLNAAKEKEVFLGFNNFQQFLGEFGWALGLLLIAIYLTVKDIARNDKTLKAEMLVNGSIFTIAMFFIFWAIQPNKDYPKYMYVLFSVLTSISSCLGFYFLVKYKNKFTLALKNIIKKQFNFLILEAPKSVDSKNIREYENKVDNLINEASEQF